LFRAPGDCSILVQNLVCTLVGNGFIRSACYGFVGNSRSGYRNNRIGISVKAKIKSALAHTMIIHYSSFIIHYSL
ncbi:MAG: hypothetical protein V8T41_08020, partial [Oscillospiraceae bacterium]